MRSLKAATLVALALALPAGCGGRRSRRPATSTPTAERAPPPSTSRRCWWPTTSCRASGTPAPSPSSDDDADAWAKTNEEPDSAQLKALVFVAGARQDLVGPPGAYGLNLVERFRTADAAHERLSYTVRDLGNAQGQFRVSGSRAPSASSPAAASKRGRSVAFSKGETVFLLSHQVAKETPSVEQFKAAVRKWYSDISD